MDERVEGNSPEDSRSPDVNGALPAGEMQPESREATGPGTGAEHQDDASDAQPPPPPPPGWRPADYYAAPPRAPRFPRWVPLTGGVVAIVAIGVMAMLGMFLQSGGLAKLVAIAFGQMSSEAERMFDSGVAPDARAAFKQSLLAVRDGIADGTVELESALPLLQEMQKATGDRKLSIDEVEDLTGSFERSLSGPADEDPSEPRSVDL
ncbi:MAG: hypothetical protein NDJ92_17400 [Thermoanaerobaculia bacterium]|nr:hypothetical protein [Thermoanaerobaculia bacterium]